MLCCPTELAAYEHGLMPFAKHRHCCLGCCEKDAAYLAQWHRTKDWLHKHKPCSGCAVTLVSGQGKPLRQAVQQDESPTPPPAPSNTTTVRQALQELKGLGIHCKLVEQVEEEQKDLRARVIKLEALLACVEQLEEEQQDSRMKCAVPWYQLCSTVEDNT